MELITGSPDIKLQHCFLKFDVKKSALAHTTFEQYLQQFNEKMRDQLSKRGSLTPGKIMHTKFAGL